MQSKSDADTGLQLLASVRAGFIARQTTMADWCRANGVAHQNVRLALLGGWRGPKAKELIKKISQAAGVELRRGEHDR